MDLSAAGWPSTALRRASVWRIGWYPAAVAVVVVAVLLGVMIGPAGPTWWRVPLAVLDHLPLISIDSGVTDAGVEHHLAGADATCRARRDRRIDAVARRAPATRACSATRSSTRTCSAPPPGAGLGATIVFTVARSSTADWPVDPAPAMAFIFALATVALTYVVGAAFGGTKSGVTLVLAGVAMVSLTTAIQTFLLQRHSEVVREVYTWILGRLSSASWADVRMVAPYVIVSSIVLLLHRRHLDLLRIGDDEAATLGAPVARVRLVVVVAATLGTAAVVAVSGLIGFVGIVVPHMVRLIAGTSYRQLLPLTIAFGAAFLILADIPGRVLTDPAETPIGVVTAFLGAPFFIVLLRTRQVAR